MFWWKVAPDILKAGGSAVDAAIAANAMEGVVEPMMNGVGGDLMAMVWGSGTAKLWGYNGAGRAARSSSLDEIQGFARAAGAPAGFMPTHGPLPVTVPGAPRGWCDLHAKFGRLPLSDVLAPAVRYAREGFPLGA